jgi:hypothetical protein
MERQSLQPTFTDSFMADWGGPRTTDFFQTCQTQIP